MDSNGNPLGFHLTAGQASECKFVETLLDQIRLPHSGPGRPRKRPQQLAGDKGYSFDFIRKDLQARGILAVIPRRSNQLDGRSVLNKKSYRKRNIIERCVGWMKENRRLATRYDKLAQSFSAFVQLTMIQRCFRNLELINTA